MLGQEAPIAGCRSRKLYEEAAKT